MNQEERRIPYQGKDYIWTGAEWYEAGTHLTPPAGIIHDLNALIEDDQSAEDSLLNRVPQLLAAACQARDAGQYRRAEELLRRAQFMEPGNLAVLAVLSSVYRASGYPAQAVAATEAYRDANHPALLHPRRGPVRPRPLGGSQTHSRPFPGHRKQRRSLQRRPPHQSRASGLVRLNARAGLADACRRPPPAP